MNEKQLIELFAEAVEIEPALLALESKISDFPEWTSLAWLTIMSLVDERLNVQLTAKEIRGCTTVQDIVNCVAAKVASVPLS